MSNSKPGSLYIISAPSGAGKTSLVAALINKDNLIDVSVSHTTRARRPGEQDGVNYNFVSISEFEGLVSSNGFLEHAKVYDNYYGTSKAWVEQRLAQGRDVILEIDWQGGQQVRSLMPNAIGIFILPPSKAALRERLEGRNQDDAEVINRRMALAKIDCSHCGEYDYLLINDHFDPTLEAFRAIFMAERLKTAKQKIEHSNIISGLLS